MSKIKLKNAVKVIILLTFLVLFVIGFYIYPNEIVIRKVTLNLNNWDKKHENLKVAVISDIHAGAPFVGIKKLVEIVKLTNKEKPDLIVLPGDFVEKGVLGGIFVKPEIIAGVLTKLKSKYGMVAVLGNHDCDYSAEKIQLALEKEKISVLDNNVKKLTINRKPLWIAGLADLTKGYPDLEGTLSKIKGKESILMLSHNPDVFPLIPKWISLTLSGHTHGGQVIIPFVGRLIIPSNFGDRYAYGYIHENDKDLYVSAGIGTSRLPIRFGVVPEIVILTLKSK